MVTIEIVSDFLALDTDSGIFRYFCGHFGDWLPVLHQVDRTTFVRQAAHMRVMKEQLFAQLSQHVPHDPLAKWVCGHDACACQRA